MDKEGISIRAFTLAEVLITLGIIGVVAAMTIPNLIRSYQNQYYYNAFQKSYSVLSQVISRLINENNDMSGAITEYGSISNAIKSKTTALLKYCPAGTLDGECMPANSLTKRIDNVSSNENFSAYDRIVLADGIAIASGTNSSSCTWVYGSMQNTCGEITIDINGVKPPNKRGRDIFYFFLTNNKLIPRGTPGTGVQEWLEWYCNPTIADQNSGKSCAARLIRDQKMNY